MHQTTHEIQAITFLTILLKTLEIMKYLKHLRAKDGYYSNVEHFELIDSV
jgi:hypothetical protein